LTIKSVIAQNCRITSRPFWIAQSDVTKKLDDLHADFLLQKHNNGGGGVIDKAMSCLL
jgi:hypothetical protein